MPIHICELLEESNKRLMSLPNSLEIKNCSSLLNLFNKLLDLTVFNPDFL